MAELRFYTADDLFLLDCEHDSLEQEFISVNKILKLLTSQLQRCGLYLPKEFDGLSNYFTNTHKSFFDLSGVLTNLYYDLFYQFCAATIYKDELVARIAKILERMLNITEYLINIGEINDIEDLAPHLKGDVRYYKRQFKAIRI